MRIVRSLFMAEPSWNRGVSPLTRVRAGAYLNVGIGTRPAATWARRYWMERDTPPPCRIRASDGELVRIPDYSTLFLIRSFGHCLNLLVSNLDSDVALEFRRDTGADRRAS